MYKNAVTVTFCALAFFMARIASAHFIWATIDLTGTKVRLEVAESPGVSIVPILGKLIPSMKRTQIGPVTDEPGHTYATAHFSGPALSGGVDLLYGLYEGFLIHWSAKVARNLEGASNPIGLQAEIIISRSKGALVALITKTGKPVAGADIEIYLPGKSEIRLKSGPDGCVILPRFKVGPIAIGADIRQDVGGDYKGTRYKQKREMCSLTVMAVSNNGPEPRGMG